MKHDPHGDRFEATTNELVAATLSRFNAVDSLHSLLALMVEASDEMPTSKQFRMAATLRDAAQLIEERPGVRDWIEQIKLARLFIQDEGMPT